MIVFAAKLDYLQIINSYKNWPSLFLSLDDELIAQSRSCMSKVAGAHC